MLRIARVGGVCALLLTTACDSPQDTNEALAPKQTDLAIQAAIVDGSSSGNSFFRFVPVKPHGSSPALPAKNELGVNPTMEICELSGTSCAPVIAQFTRADKDSHKHLLHPGPIWSAKWRTSHSHLDAEKNYRVRVRLDSYELGYADIDVVEKKEQLSGVDRANYIGVVKGAEVTFNFWIQAGIFTWIKRPGGLAVGDGGNVALVVPAGNVHVGILSGRTAPSGANLVGGTYYEFVPAELTFTKPAPLVIRYDAKQIPEGVTESNLKLLQYRDGAWSEVPGAKIDIGKDVVFANISGNGSYAIGVLPTVAPVVNVVLNSGAPVLGSPLSAVHRLSSGAPRGPCTNNLRDAATGTLANEYWRGPHSIAVVNGECPFEGYITRVGTYQLEGVIDGVSGQSAPLTVGVPAGTTLSFSGIPDGPHYTAATIVTDNIVVTVRDGAGNPLNNTEVQVQSADAGFNFGGAATNTYAHTTDAAGQIQLPPGTWTLRNTPGVNTLRAHLPNTGVSGTHEITTNSGPPARLFANPVPAIVAYATPLNVSVFVQDANGVAVNLNGITVTAQLSNGSTSIPLGTSTTVNGEATFAFDFVQHGPNHTLTFTAADLSAHTTNAFEIMGSPPATPGELRLTGVTQNSISLEVRNVTFQGSNPVFQVRYMEAPGGAFAMVDVPVSAAEFVPAALTNLTPGTQFEISARACDSYGCSAWSSNLAVPTLQPAPQNLRTTSIGTTFAMIAWEAQTLANGATHNFEVWVRQGSGALQLFSTTPSTEASLIGLAPNTQYTAEVRACNASGCTASQHSFTTLPLPLPPGAPSRLQINAQSFASIGLAWTDGSSNEAGFHIMKRTLPQTTLTRVATVGAGVTTYTDIDVIQAQTVVYQVVAFNEGGAAGSNIISTVVPAGQTQPMAAYNTMLTQQGTAGQAAIWPPRVRLMNMSNNTALVGVPVTFTITGGSGSFATGGTSAVVNTAFGGIATAPNWILGSGTNTVTATTTLGTVVFTAQGN